jgi:cobalt/nickel transport system permease protein
MIHIRVGPTSVHLLLNGLVGVILGKRACVAIPVAIVLQAVLLGHGGFQTLGVNAVVITLPALFAGWFFHANRHAPTMGVKEAALAVSYVLHPALLLVLAPLLVIWRRMEKNWNSDGVFRAGFVAGAGAIILTAVLNSAVLVAGGEEDWHVIASLILAAHLPLAIIEGFVVAFAVSFLMSVQPALLRCEQ